MDKLETVLNCFMGKKLIMKIFVYFGFIISGVNTFNAYNKDGYIWTIPVIILASTILIFEVGKAVCFIQYVANSHKEWLIMWICLMLLSVIGNICFFVDWGLSNDVAKLDYEELKSKKVALETQIEYKKADKARIVKEKESENEKVNKNEDTYNETLKEYNDTIKSLQEQINSKNKELTDAVRKKYKLTPDILKGQIAKLNESLNKAILVRGGLQKNNSNTISDKDAKIEIINNEIRDLEDKIESLNISESIPEKKVKGATALFVYLGIQWKFMELSLIIFMSFTFEIVLCMIYLHTKDMSWRDFKNKVIPNPFSEVGNNFTPPKKENEKSIEKPKVTIPREIAAFSTMSNPVKITTSTPTSIHHVADPSKLN